MNIRNIIIEGNIGVGKSTFLNLLKKYLDAIVVYEPHTKWQNINNENLLDKFYKDINRWAYTFQVYAFLTRTFEFEKAAKLNTDNKILFLERSIFSDRYCFAQNCFELGFMTRLEFELYKDIWNDFFEKFYFQNLGFVYLKVAPEISYTRIAKRNRGEESNISLDYLNSLAKKHDEWLILKKGVLDKVKNYPVLVLDCSKDFENDEKQQLKHINAILNFFNLNKKIDLKANFSIDLNYL